MFSNFNNNKKGQYVLQKDMFLPVPAVVEAKGGFKIMFWSFVGTNRDKLAFSSF